MVARKGSGHASTLPEPLRPLVEQLAALSDADRRKVIDAVQASMRPSVVLRPVPWDVVDRARGIVKLGGNAVEDCNALYDG